MTKRRLFVTGSAGFVGSHVVELATKKRHQVFCVDNYSSGYFENVLEIPKSQQKRMTNPAMIEDGKQVIARVDVIDDRAIDAAMRDFRPQAVIHLAAQPSLLKSMDDPIFDAMMNIYGTLNVLKMALKHKVRRFVFASTSAVYADSCTFMSEHDAGRFEGPSSYYGLSKYTAEQYVTRMFENSICLRFANVYGPRQRPIGENQLIPRAIRHILYRDEFEVYGDGEQCRDFVYVKDVANIVLRAAQDDTVGAFNLSTNRSTSVNTILGLLEELTEWYGEWKYGEARDNRKFGYMYNAKLLRAYPGIRFTLPTEGLEQTLEWWKRKKEKENEKV